METKQRFLLISFIVELLLVAVLVGFNTGLWISALVVSAVAAAMMLLQRTATSASAKRMLFSVAPFFLMQAATAVYGIDWCSEATYMVFAESFSPEAATALVASITALVCAAVAQCSFLWGRLLRYVALFCVSRMVPGNQLFADVMLGYAILQDLACLPSYYKKNRDKEVFRNTPSAMQLLLLLAVGIMLKEIGASAPLTMFLAGDFNIVIVIFLLTQALILLRVGTHTEEETEDSFAFIIVPWGYLLIKLLKVKFSWHPIALAEAALTMILSMQTSERKKKNTDLLSFFDRLPVLLASLLLVPILVRIVELQLLWIPVWFLICFMVPRFFCSKRFLELFYAQLVTWGALIGILISLYGWKSKYILAIVFVLTFLIALAQVISRWQEKDIPKQTMRYIALIPLLMIVILLTYTMPHTMEVQKSEEEGILYVTVREGENALRLHSLSLGLEKIEFPLEEDAVYQTQITAQTGLIHVTAVDDENREHHFYKLFFSPEPPAGVLDEAQATMTE